MNNIFMENGNIISENGDIILSKDELQDMILSEQKETFKKGRKMLENLGVAQEYNLVKLNKEDSDLVFVKKGYEYNSIFRVELRKIMRNKDITLSLYAKAFIGQFTPFISFPENSILVDGKRPTIIEFGDMLGVKKSKMYDVLKELENTDIIKRVNMGNKNIVYFNPFLYSCGLVDKATIDLFENSIYAENKTVEYVQ